MSENNTSDQVLESSVTSDNGNEGFDGRQPETGLLEPSEKSDEAADLGFSSGEGDHSSVRRPEDSASDGSLAKSSEFKPNPETLLSPVLAAEESNVIASSESFIDAEQANLVAESEIEISNDDNVLIKCVPQKDKGSATEVEPMPEVDAHASVDHITQNESISVEVDHADNVSGAPLSSDGSVQAAPDGNLTENAGKEDMFVDAPDQLSVIDMRNADIGDSMSIVEAQKNPEEKSDIKEAQPQLLEATQVRPSIDELVHLQALVTKTTAEKEILAQEFKVEKEIFTKEIANLHHQLEVLVSQQSSFEENDNGLIDRLRRAEMGNMDVDTQVSEIPLKQLVSECSRFMLCLKGALDERLQTEGSMRELNAILYTKDQEIEDLHEKVSELSVFHDVVVSYLESIQKIWSQNLKESSEIQLEKDLHVETFTNRMLSSLASVFPQEDFLCYSVADRMYHVEKGNSLLIERHNHYISEINQLWQYLAELKSDIRMPEDYDLGRVFEVARDVLLEHKNKELDLIKKVDQLEYENRRLLEQVDKDKEMANAEVDKFKMELEQERIKSATAKEKLTLAVSKGKALVQQRDSLKQSLAEKSGELEKCLLELQEKSSALQSADFRSAELVKIEELYASLQESFSQKDLLLKEIEEVLSQIGFPEGLQSMDIIERVRWLVDQKNLLEGVSLEFCKLKDALSLIDFPVSISSSDLESKVSYLGESFSRAKEDISKLQDEIASSLTAAAEKESELVELRGSIDLLNASLSAEKQEKISLQVGLDDLSWKYEEVNKKKHQVSSEKDLLMRVLLDASGVIIDNEGGVNEASINTDLLIEKCIGKIKEKSDVCFKSNHVEPELVERIQCLLYLRDLELVLCEKILEEEILERLRVNNLLGELSTISQEVMSLKVERDMLQKDLERSEEKSALLREKLSMAVKKGKGMVLEREGLKNSLNEKNEEIDKLKLDLEQQESALVVCRDQINKLHTDLECITKLESELVAVKDQRDQLEQFLAESNNMIQRVFESIEGIALPTDAFFEEPIEKLKWLSKSFAEYQVAKIHADQELEKVKEEAISLSNKLTEAYMTIKSVEDALSESKKNISLLADEKKDIDLGKTYIEQELEKAKLEVSSQVSMFEEACATVKSLENSLSLAEKNISILLNEKEEAQVGRTSAETELERVKEETVSQASELAEVYITISSLEDKLSRAGNNVSLLIEEKNDLLAEKTNLQKEIEKVKQQAGSQAIKLEDSFSTIKSLEDALLVAESNISVRDSENKNLEQEITALNAKLTACMAELAGTHGGLERQSVELFSHLNHLRILVKDEALLVLLNQCFEKKIESLRDMEQLLKDIRNQLVVKGSEKLQIHPVTEKSHPLVKLFLDDLNSVPNGAVDTGDIVAADIDSILPCLTKIMDKIHMKDKLTKDKFDSFSSLVDELIAALLLELQATRDEVVVVLERMECLKQKVETLEFEKQTQELAISVLKNDITVLLSACTDAAQDMEFGIGHSPEIIYSPKLEKFNHSLDSGVREAGGDTVDEQRQVDGTKYAKEAENLLLATRKVQSQIKVLENMRDESVTTINDLQNELREARVTVANVIEERDATQKRVLELENDLEMLQNFCSEMRLKLDGYQTKENLLKEREAELSSLSGASTMKNQEAYGLIMSQDEVKVLLEKLNGIQIPCEELEIGNPESQSSFPVQKLFYIIDSITALKHQVEVKLLSHDKEEMQASLATQIHENEHLKKVARKIISDDRGSEKMRSEVVELELGLEKLIKELGGNDLLEDKRSDGISGLLALLENLVNAIIAESETSKLEAQDLGAKLLGNQKFVDALSSKVKLLEDSISERPTPPEMVQERRIFEASPSGTGSEISEIEDVAPLGKSISPVPSAAHVRTMRKGSTDHLALTIDSESTRLINHKETDEDKGHVFKSLNTSGLIPKQGRMIADRIDGIWVSGGRVLMSRPGARMGIIAYWIFLNIWLVGTIL